MLDAALSGLRARQELLCVSSFVRIGNLLNDLLCPIGGFCKIVFGKLDCETSCELYYVILVDPMCNPGRQLQHLKPRLPISKGFIVSPFSV